MDQRAILTDTLICDWLEHIHDVNEERERIITNGSKFYIPFMSIPTPVVKTTFIICDFFEVGPRTKYLALDIYEKFMCNKFWELFSSKEENSSSVDWQNERKKLADRAKLHLVCCIQLASKMDSVPLHMAMPQVQSALNWMDSTLDYFPDEILEAEFSVYKMIDFKIPFVTTFDSMEVLLAALSLLSLPNFNDVAYHILDLAYMQHEQLYSQLQLATHGSLAKNKSDKIKYMVVESNMLLLNAGIIECALTILDVKLHTKDRILHQLQELSDIQLCDIQCMSKIIIAMVNPVELTKTESAKS